MQNIIKRSIYSILIFFVGLFIITSFFTRAIYNSVVYGDYAILQSQNLGVFLPLVVVLLFISVFLYKLGLKLNKYSKKVVIPVSLLISFIIQIGLIFAFTRLPNADSQTVLSLAVNMLYNHDYSSLQKGGYLFMFPHNLSVVFYLKALLYLFPDNYLVIKIFNILFTTIISLMTYLIYKELNYKSTDKDYGVLFFAETFIPSLLMCNLIYNDIISTVFFISAIYFLIKFIKGKSLKYIIASSVMLSIGNYFRNVGIIILIAAAIYILLYIRKIGIQRVIASLCILAILFVIPNNAQDKILQSTHIVSESVYTNNAPIYMWLNMGINKDSIGYWDYMQSYNIYQRQAMYNKEVSTELYKKEIQKKLSGMSFVDLIEMYYSKITWIWTEGTYQIETYGIGNDTSSNLNRGMGMRQRSYSYTTFATDLFKGDSLPRSGLLWVLYVMNFLMYCFILVRLISGFRRKRFEEVILVLVILGFIGFYILWEIKSRYIYPVYPLLIILSYMGYKDVYDFMSRKNLLQYIPFGNWGE